MSLWISEAACSLALSGLRAPPWLRTLFFKTPVTSLVHNCSGRMNCHIMQIFHCSLHFFRRNGGQQASNQVLRIQQLKLGGSGRTSARSRKLHLHCLCCHPGSKEPHRQHFLPRSRHYHQRKYLCEVHLAKLVTQTCA